jgi:very-short-patch-repair endonuclease
MIMRSHHIVMGQKIPPALAQRARELRSNQTPAEQMLWEKLRGNRLNGFHFRRQQVIGGFIVDFYCHRAGLAVELDGKIHEFQQEYDGERERLLAEYGIRVLRFKNDEVVADLAGVMEKISLLCKKMD